LKRHFVHYALYIDERVLMHETGSPPAEYCDLERFSTAYDPAIPMIRYSDYWQAADRVPIAGM